MHFHGSLIVLSRFQAAALLEGRQRGDTELAISLDLGMTESRVLLRPGHVKLPDGQMLTWSQLEEINRQERACFLVEEREISKIRFYSDSLNRYYSLMPTEGAPTMLISGLPMHRIKGTDPYRDTLSKLETIAPLSGMVLDTTMGLGYTAIEAAKTAEHVTTIELDPLVVEVCRLNPWSRDLFHNPKITMMIGDAFEEIRKFKDRSFKRIIHDPPTFSLAGELYSTDFYRQLRRVLKSSGRLFHYVGDPNSRSGRSVTKGVIRRLQEAGFTRIKSRPMAFGVVANG